MNKHKKIKASKKDSLIKKDQKIKIKSSEKKPAMIKNNQQQFLQGALIVLASFLLLFFCLKMLTNNLTSLVNSPFAGNVQTEIWQAAGAEIPSATPTKTPSASQINPDNLTTEKPRQLSLRETEKEKYFIIPGPHQEFDETSFLSSPDGQSFAYISRQNNLEAVSVNGRLGAYYDKIIFMRFSPDSQRFAYGVRVNGQEKVVLDGVLSEPYNYLIGPFMFSPDSQYFIYKAQTGQGEVMLINNQASRLYDRIYDVFQTSDQQKLVYFGLVGSILWRTEIDLED